MQEEIRGLQAFLGARGHRVPTTGDFCRSTVTAAQTYLRDCVDRTIAVDGICGPHTGRTLESVEDDIRRRSPRGRGTRLVMHTSSRKKSDFFTFEAEAMRLEAEYKRMFPNDTVQRVLVESGQDIAEAINACAPGSIVSWDVLSHSNAGGIHISTDLCKPQASSAERQRRHVEYRADSRNPQSAKHAQFMEEDMRGMYTSRETTELVADYFNQHPTAHANTLDEIRYDRFSTDCYVELHGCRTVNDAASAADLFVGNLSARLPSDATVVGHTRGSFPQGSRGYRHGEVGVYRGGCEVHRGPREPLRLPNSSTPGQDDECFGTSSARRTRSGGGARRVPSSGRGSRDFKNDWPDTGTRRPPGSCTPPRREPPRECTPPLTCPPRRDPPRECTPPSTRPPRREPPRVCTPPRTRPPRREPPRECTPPTHDPHGTGTLPPRDRDPKTPRGRDRTKEPRGDRTPKSDDRRDPPKKGTEVPWRAILTGAAVVGGLALQHKRDRDRDRRRDSDRNPPRSTVGSDTRVPKPRDIQKNLGSLGRGLTRGFGRL